VADRMDLSMLVGFLFEWLIMDGKTFRSSFDRVRNDLFKIGIRY